MQFYQTHTPKIFFWFQMKVNFNQIIKYSLTDVRKVYSPGFFEGSRF